MALDFNKVANKLKKRKNLGVTKDGKLNERDPFNNGNSNIENSQEATTLKPERFFVN